MQDYTVLTDLGVKLSRYGKHPRPLPRRAPGFRSAQHPPAPFERGPASPRLSQPYAELILQGRQKIEDGSAMLTAGRSRPTRINANQSSSFIASIVSRSSWVI